MSEIEIEIVIKKKIFGCRKYCENIKGFKCNFLFDCIDGEGQMCVICDRKELNTELVDGFPLFVKCDECKATHQKALKEKEVKKCHGCGTEIHDDSLTSCPACEFEFLYKSETALDRI